jgi:4-hydroxythreonine-4-phosphate dehydrogenase
MGDPAGIGPEVVAKAVDSVRDCNILVIGDKSFLRYKDMKVIKDIDEADPSEPNLLDLDNISEFKMGKPTAETGRASVQYIEKAVSLIRERKIDGIVTAPISKSAINEAGYRFSGHTDLLANITKKDVRMMFASKEMRVVLVTIHIPLSCVPQAITEDKVYRTIEIANSALVSWFGIENPKISVLALNPHAGEEGIFGTEEDMIRSAIDRTKAEGISAEGPFPPDTAFLKKADCFVAMYHDQGLIPLKLLSFDTAVNLTLGLPFIRTSPDHGCGFDIAGKEIASPTSMIEAIKLSQILLAKRRVV